MDHAGLGFVVRGDIAILSMVRARSSKSDAENSTAPTPQTSISLGIGEHGLDGGL
jgi:hypothetical protein